jgi:hypothetical protein
MMDHTSKLHSLDHTQLATGMCKASPTLLYPSTTHPPRYDLADRYNRWLIVLPIGFGFGSTSLMERMVDPVIGAMGWSVHASSNWLARSMVV